MTQTGPCAACGTPVQREMPHDPAGPYRDLLARLRVVCDDCADAQAADREHEERQRQRERDDEARRRRIAASEMPAELRGITDLDNDPARIDAVAAARAWAAGDLDGLLLHGPVGAGKTRIAACAAWALLARRSLRWYSAPLLLARLSSSFESPLRAKALDALSGAHMRSALVLDDLDKTRPSEYGAEQVFTALDARVAEGAPLLLTSNSTLRELGDRWPEPYGEAIASRLAGYCALHEVAGPDRRLRGPS